MWPVTMEEARLARNSTAPTISSTSATRPIGVARSISARTSGFSSSAIASSLRTQHEARRRPGAEKAPGDVDVHPPLPVRQGKLGRRLADRDGGAVDQHVETSQALGEIGEAALDLGLVGDVEDEALGFAADLLDRLRRRGGRRLVSVEDRDRGADAGGGDGGRAADAAAAAGDGRPFALE